MLTRGNVGWVVIPIVAAVVIIAKFWAEPWTPVRVVGLVFIAAGFVLVSVARYQLGPSFSLTPQARALVTRGLYSYVRHPVYVFSTLGIVGLILYVERFRWFWALAPLIILQVFRARAEERVLIAKFGDEYRRYREHTWL